MVKARLDGDRCAVHVHFPIPYAIEPGPGQRVVPGVQVSRNDKLQLRWDGSLSSATEIALDIERTAPFKRLDHHPPGILRRLRIFGDADLTGTPTMGGTALERQPDCFTRLVQVAVADFKRPRAQLTGKIAAVRCQGVVIQRGLPIRDGVRHDQVSCDHGDEENGRQNIAGRDHSDERGSVSLRPPSM